MNVSDLDGWRLDMAVAEAEGYVFGEPRQQAGSDFMLYPLSKPGWKTLGAVGWTPFGGFSENVPRFSTDWAAGGPIIEREQIVVMADGRGWLAFIDPDFDMRDGGTFKPLALGPTYLIAAMRAYVASKRPSQQEPPCPHAEQRTVHVGHDEYESVCAACGATIALGWVNT